MIPDWLSDRLYTAICGEIYPQIRAIAVRYDEDNNVLIRYYLDREPTEFDYESIDVVAVELDASLGEYVSLVNKLDVECIYFRGALNGEKEALDRWLYARREYDMEDNPS